MSDLYIKALINSNGNQKISYEVPDVNYDTDLFVKLAGYNVLKDVGHSVGEAASGVGSTIGGIFSVGLGTLYGGFKLTTGLIGGAGHLVGGTLQTTGALIGATGKVLGETAALTGHLLGSPFVSIPLAALYLGYRHYKGKLERLREEGAREALFNQELRQYYLENRPEWSDVLPRPIMSIYSGITALPRAIGSVFGGNKKEERKQPTYAFMVRDDQ
ncbi:MAG: hypothetical protein QXI58_00115 [Candidatus Micrarchaeia archaeon]